MPANAGARCMIAFQNRTCVHVTFLPATEFAQEIVDLIQFGRDYMMIIVAPGVTRDACMRSFFYSRSRVACRALKVIQRQDNDRARAWQDFLRIATLLFAAIHVAHLTRGTLFQPITELLCMSRSNARGDTA